MQKVKIIGFPIIKGEVMDTMASELPIPESLTPLALSRDGNDWDKMCEQLPNFGFINPIGKIHITHLEIDGVRKVFH